MYSFFFTLISVACSWTIILVVINDLPSKIGKKSAGNLQKREIKPEKKHQKKTKPIPSSKIFDYSNTEN